MGAWGQVAAQDEGVGECGGVHMRCIRPTSVYRHALHQVSIETSGTERIIGAAVPGI